MPNVAEAMLGKHKPVLLKESLEALELKSGETFLDGTLGAGGHSREVLRLHPKVKVIGLDQDPAVAKAMAGKPDNIEVCTENFRNLDQALEKVGVDKVDAILLDIGLSSDQLENSGRGFSFLRDEPLDMRMSDKGLRAKDLLNSWDEHAIELILRGFGEEKDSRKIARAIVDRREEKPFATTFDLVDTVLSVKPKRGRDKINPATKTFQAIRIATNDELSALELGLEKGFKHLKSGGRFAVITFHSLEDRIVKNFFRDRVKDGSAVFINKKPIIATAYEIRENPRSRSAKLRVIAKI